MKVNIFERLAIDIQEVGDPRSGPIGLRKHRLFDIVVIALCSTIVGGDGYESMVEFGISKLDWLKQFLSLENGIPSISTFRRVISAICPKEFSGLLTVFARDFSELIDEHEKNGNKATKKRTLAVDGKTHRGSHDRRADKRALHTVSAFDTGSGLTIGEVAVDDKSNEIVAIPELLRILSIKGAVITIDAIGCQKKIAQQIQGQGGGFVLALKKNHGDLFASVQSLFSDIACLHDLPASTDRYTTVDADHGRTETRTVIAIPSLPVYGLSKEWPEIKTFVALDSTREINGKICTERRFYISDQAPSSKVHGEYIRDHWLIENQLHWTLDVTFREDASRVRTANGPRNLGTLRRIALNLIKNETSEKGSKKMKSFRAGLTNRYLEKILFQSRVLPV